ncbi:MAG: sigma-70 family RNA polymerase sigma factor [Acidobacteria bacterium]|nr:sigma-70 family RNA polymerase sigma factor [Acidobacteriota bacterium]
MALDKFDKRSAEASKTFVEVENLSDHELVEATKQGDEAAFAEIVRRYRNPITNYLYRFLNDYEEAVDLAQETFVRVYFARERYHTEYAFSTYIYRIATNLAISELRKRKRRKLVSLTGLFRYGDESDARDFEPADASSLADDDLIENEQAKTIARAIATLPEKYRAPVVLRDVEGKTYEEIAQILQLGLNTTKSRISRARKLLKEKLKSYL